MKSLRILVIPTLLMAGLTVASADTGTKAPAKRTFWMGPMTGSNIPVGSVEYMGRDASAPKPNSHLANDSAALRGAVADLDAKMGVVAGGRLAIWNAVYTYTRVPTDKLQKQRESSNLSVGELVVANSLAQGSNKSFEDVVALRAKTGGWSRLARDLGIDEQSIIKRLHGANEMVIYAKNQAARRDGNTLEPTIHPIKVRGTGN